MQPIVVCYLTIDWPAPKERLRPAQMSASVNFRFNDFEVDTARHELRRAGAVVRVEPQVFDLIVHLVRNRGRVVGKHEYACSSFAG